MTHDFQEQLRYSEAMSHESFWQKIYEKAFPNMVSNMLASGDVKSQRMGIDRVVLLNNGKSLYIDEKKRRKDYDDILLEHISISTTGAPGWMEKNLAIDYLAYAFMPSQRVYLFPWPILRRAWLYYKDQWIDNYNRVPAINNGYETISVAVPIAVLLNAVKTASIIQL